MAKKAVKKKPPSKKKAAKRMTRMASSTMIPVPVPAAPAFTVQFHRIAGKPPVPGDTYPIAGGVLDVTGFHSASPASATVTVTLYSSGAPIAAPAVVVGHGWSVSIAGVVAGDYLLEATVNDLGTTASTWITITIP